MIEESDLLKAPPDPRIGLVIKDKYKIVKKMGEGGMGAVYEAEHLLIQRKVAIKCLHANFATNETIVKRFHNEALAATAIGHQNIVDVTDMDRFDDGAIFMVLEFLDGQELAAVLGNDGAQPLPRVVHIIAQVCDALAAAHEKGIVHRDLKPENIFLIRRGNDPDFVKLLDFGIAKFKGVGKGMTRTGTVMGSPHYMSPEQAKGDTSIDHRADIYSLGVILFHALTGRVPFDDETFPMLVVQICNEPPPSIRVYRPDLPEDLEALITRMLAKSPRDRPSDCTFIKEALLRYAGFSSDIMLADSAPSWSGSSASSPSSPSFGSGVSASTTPPEARSKAPIVVAGLALILLLLVGGAILAFTFGPSSEDVSPPPPPIPTVPSQPPPENVVKAPGQQPQPIAGHSNTAPLSEKTVRVQIETTPSSAELFLDGDRIANPFDGDLPQQDEPRVLEAKLAGHKTVRQELSLRFAQRVKMRLAKGSGIDDRRSQHAKTPAEQPPTPANNTTPAKASPPPTKHTPPEKTPTDDPPVAPANDLKQIRVLP